MFPTMSERQMCMMTFLKWNDLFSSVQSITENYEIYENNVIVTKSLKIKINNANELGPYPMGSEGWQFTWPCLCFVYKEYWMPSNWSTTKIMQRF